MNLQYAIPQEFNLYAKDLAIQGPEVEGSKAVEKIRRLTPTHNKLGSSGSKRRKVQCFSDRSKRRFQFIIRQPGVPLLSMWTATYHLMAPSDGKVVKEQLNKLFAMVRKHYPGTEYLWIMEFQTKTNHPHLHILFSEPAGDELRHFLATAWNRITQESNQHLRMHKDPKTLIPWKTGDGGYLLKKHFSKEKQHIVPVGFKNVGRFWGNSKGVSPKAWSISVSQLLRETYLHNQQAWKYILRTVRRFQEAKVREYGHKHKSGVMRNIPAWIKGGARIMLQLVQYLKRQFPIEAALNYGNVLLTGIKIQKTQQVNR